MSHGGRRPGSGRKPKPKEIARAETVLREASMGNRKFKTALKFAMAVINDPKASMDHKCRLAIAAMPYQSARGAELHTGKKEQALADAKAPDSGTSLGELMAKRQRSGVMGE